MTVPHKIHVKLGQNELLAEGTKEVVQEQYQMFLEAIKGSLAPAQPPSNQINSVNGVPAEQVDEAVLGRVFLVDDDGQVSLRMLPSGDQRESDGLILLLYGFRRLGNQNDVLSGRLLNAAQTSGLSSVDRIDRVLAPHMDLITKGGVRAGSRWGLRNTGITRAEAVIRQMI